VLAYSELEKWTEQVLSLKYRARANGYSVCFLDSSELLSPTLIPEENQLCVAMTLDSVLYCVNDPLSRKQSGSISWEALGDPFEEMTMDLVHLMPCLPDILTITGRVGHTRAYSPHVIKSFLQYIELSMASLQILALVHSEIASVDALMPSHLRTKQRTDLSTYAQRINELIEVYRVAQEARITLKGMQSFWKTEWNEQYEFQDDDAPPLNELKSISNYWTFLVDGKIQWRVIDAQIREHFYKFNQVTYGDKGKGSVPCRLRPQGVSGPDANAYPYETKKSLVLLWINPALEKMTESVEMVTSYITHIQTIQDRMQACSRLGLFKDQHRRTQYSAALRVLNNTDIDPTQQRADVHQWIQWSGLLVLSGWTAYSAKNMDKNNLYYTIVPMVLLALLTGWVVFEQSSKLKKDSSDLCSCVSVG